MKPGLLADGEEAHRRVVNAHDLVRQHTTHHGELRQVLGLALHVGAAVDEHNGAEHRRHGHGEPGADDARQATQQQGGRGEHGTGVPRRHHGRRPALGHLLAGDHH